MADSLEEQLVVAADVAEFGATKVSVEENSCTSWRPRTGSDRMWRHLLLECIESDEREAGMVENGRRQLIEERVVAVRRNRDAWLSTLRGGDSSSSVVRRGHEAAGQRTTEGSMQLAQRQGPEWLVCALIKMKIRRLTGEIPDMLSC